MAGTNNINSNGNDPFEEFEFRPINEGLGFQKRQRLTTAASTMGANIDSGFEVNPARNTPRSNPSFSAPLPRTTAPRPNAAPVSPKVPSFEIPTIEDDSIAKAQTAVNEILKNLNQKRHLDFLNETEKQKTLLKKSKPFFFAATLDAMLITAMFLLSMIAMLSITKVDLLMNLGHANTSMSVFAATGGLFLSIMFIYMVTTRAFAGFTPGEWAFDQQVGDESHQKGLSYIPRVAARTVLVTVTGFILLPVLSYLFNKDIAGQLTGTPMFRKPNG